MYSNVQEILTKAFDLYSEDQRELGQLIELGVPKTIEKGTTFIREGENANTFYVIVSGAAKITMDSGLQPVTIYTAQAEEVIGWSSLVEPRLYKGDATAQTELEVLEFNAGEILAEMKTHPRLGYLVMYRVSQFLSQRLLHAMFEAVSVPT